MKCRWCSLSFATFALRTFHEQNEHPREYWADKVRYHEYRAKISLRLANEAREQLAYYRTTK
jgi:hypothetical protein